MTSDFYKVTTLSIQRIPLEISSNFEINWFIYVKLPPSLFRFILCPILLISPLPLGVGFLNEQGLNFFRVLKDCLCIYSAETQCWLPFALEMEVLVWTKIDLTNRLRNESTKFW